MTQFATYEEENIHYWTNRASGYSAVNQEELASDQKSVWRSVICRKQMREANAPALRRASSSMEAV